MSSFVSLLPILFPLAAGLFVLLAKPKREEFFCCVAAGLCVAAVAPLCAVHRPWMHQLSGSLVLLLQADRLSVFFLLLISIACLVTVICSCEYFHAHPRRHIFFGFLFLTLSAMMGLALSGNLVTFYMFFELMTLFSFPLILFQTGERSTQAGFVYLGFSVFGACLVLLGLFLGGEITLRPFARPENSGYSPQQLWAYLLIALGFSCKAGMMPLSNWLPTAHPEAPSPASALLSGIITKTGILGVLRTTYFLFAPAALRGTFPQTVLLSLSIITIFTGSMLAYKEPFLKKRLAFSSVSQLSYLVFGLALMTPAGLCAALFQVFFHACSKLGLFLCAGSYLHGAKARRVDELVGMGQRMPGVTAAFTCFSLSLIGIPPFGGFITKWLLASAALSVGGWLPATGVVILLCSALLTAGYLLPIVSRAYFPGRDFSAQRHDAHWPTLSSLAFLAAVNVLLGTFPAPLEQFFRSVAAMVF